MIEDKRGGERYITPWMFLVWIIIGVAIVIGVLIFNSARIDVREKEAEILAVNLINCLVDNGYLREGVLDDFDIFEECNLDREVIGNEDYWFNVSIYGGELKKEFIGGVKDFEVRCRLAESAEAEQLAKCSWKTIHVLDEDRMLRMEVLAGSNQRLTDL